MPYKFTFLSFLCLLSFVIFFATPFAIFASVDPFGGLAYRVRVDGGTIPNGSLVSLENGQYILTRKPYDLNVVGIITTNPRLELDFVGETGTLPVVQTGENLVRVSTQAGTITTGDWLTSSDIPGVAVKLTHSGMAVGQALSAYDGVEIGMVPAAISIQFYNPSLGDSGLKQTDLLRESFFDLLSVFKTASSVPAPQAFRYILAAFLLLFAVLFGFFTFGRVAARGIDAIGRNPLAKNTILLGLAINVLVSLVVIFSGLVAAYYVIKL